MSLNLSALPSMPTLDTSSLPLPSVAEVGDVIVTALDTAGDAATVVVASARRRPAMAVGIVSAAVLAMLAVILAGAAGTTRATLCDPSSRPASWLPDRDCCSGLSSERVSLIAPRGVGTVIPAPQYDADTIARREDNNSLVSESRVGCVFLALVVFAVGLSALMVRSWDRALDDRGQLRVAAADGPALGLQRPGNWDPWVSVDGRSELSRALPARCRVSGSHGGASPSATPRPT